jgi:hypothetical protein
MLSDAIDPEKIIKIMVEIDCYLEIFNVEGVCDPVHGYYRYIVSLVPYDEYRTRRSNIIDSSELHTVAILRDYYLSIMNLIKYYNYGHIPKGQHALTAVKNRHYMLYDHRLKMKEALSKSEIPVKNIFRNYLKIFVDIYYSLLSKHPLVLPKHIDYICKTYTEEFLHDENVLMSIQNKLSMDQTTFDLMVTRYLDKIE